MEVVVSSIDWKFHSQTISVVFEAESAAAETGEVAD